MFITIAEHFLLTIFFSVYPSLHQQQSFFESNFLLTEFGTAFQPRNSIELLGTFSNVPSLLQCAIKCNQNRQCRTLDYDQLSFVCRLFEGEISTETILTNSIPLSLRIAAILYNSTLALQAYLSYSQTCDQCSIDGNRYLQCMNNTCQCPLHTYWNGQMCLNQVYNGSNCSSSLSCRQDLNLTCSNQTGACGVPSTIASQVITFSQSQLYATSSGPESSVSGDFNKDGHLDLAVTNYAGNSITVLLGTGNGSFRLPAMTFASNGASPYWLVTQDFNGDGNLDLAMCDEGSNTVTVLFGRNNGSFQVPATSFSSGGSLPSWITAADLNNDNKTDIAVTNTGSNTITIFLGMGNGTFRIPGISYAADSHPSSITNGDFNVDGHIDLAVVSRFSNQLLIFLGLGNGSYQNNVNYTTGSFPYVVRTGDFNGDSKLDLVVGNYYDNTINIFISTGSSTFIVPSPALYATGSGPFDVAIQHLNGDSHMDLAVCNRLGNSFTVYLGNGDGTFGHQQSFSSMGNQPVSIMAQDYNQDGRYDLVLANYNDNTVAILLQ